MERGKNKERTQGKHGGELPIAKNDFLFVACWIIGFCRNQ